MSGGCSKSVRTGTCKSINVEIRKTERITNNDWKNCVGDFLFLNRRNGSPIDVSFKYSFPLEKLQRLFLIIY